MVEKLKLQLVTCKQKHSLSFPFFTSLHLSIFIYTLLKFFYEIAENLRAITFLKSYVRLQRLDSDLSRLEARFC